MRKNLCKMFAVILILCAIFVFSKTAKASYWSEEVVDEPQHVFSFKFGVNMPRTLKLNPQGNPTLVYGNPKIYILTVTNDGENIVTPRLSEGILASSSIDYDFDSQGNIHILFLNMDKDKVYHLYSQGERWVSEMIKEVDANSTNQVNFFIGNDNSMYLILGIGDHRVELSRKIAEGSWSQTTSFNGKLLGTAIDVQNRIHFVYQEATRLKCTVYDQLILVEPIDVVNRGLDGLSANVVVDSKGLPHIIFNDLQHCTVYYSKFVDGGFVTEMVKQVDVNTCRNSDYSTLVLDGSSQPILLFSEYQKLYLAKKNDQNWNSIEIDISENDEYPPYRFLSLMQNNEDIYIATSLIKDISKNLVVNLYTSNLRDRGSYRQVDASGVVGLVSAIDVDYAGYPYFVYHDNYINELRFAFRSGKVGWAKSRVANNIVQNGLTQNISLAVNFENGVTDHIFYYNFAEDLRGVYYADDSSKLWHSEKLNDSGNGGKHFSMTIGTNSSVEVCYNKEPLVSAPLFYKKLVGGLWSEEQLTETSGNYCSITTSEEGLPHVSAQIINNDQRKLLYTRKNVQGEWINSYIMNDPNPNDGSYKHTSIARDNSGNTYISYCLGNMDVNVAQYTDNIEEPVVYDSGIDSPYATFIEVNSFGSPVVCSKQECAIYHNNEWIKKDVKSNIIISGLKIDLEDKLHLSFYDTRCNCLKHMILESSIDVNKSHSFGSLSLGTSESWNAVIRNDGSEAISIGSITLANGSADYSIVNNECSGNSLNAGGQCRVQVLFSPQVLDEQSADLRIEVDDPFFPLLKTHMTGSAFESPSPAIEVSPRSYDFGSVILGGETQVLQVTVENQGDAAMNLTGIELSDTDNFNIIFEGNGTVCANQMELVGGSSCVFKVVLNPSSEGVFNARITIRSTDPNRPEEIVSVAGKGLEPPEVIDDNGGSGSGGDVSNDSPNDQKPQDELPENDVPGETGVQSSGQPASAKSGGCSLIK